MSVTDAWRAPVDRRGPRARVPDVVSSVDLRVVVAALVGLGCVLLLVATAGRAARVADQAPASSWLGLLGGRVVGELPALEGAAQVLAVAGLLLCWGVLLRCWRALRVRAVVGVAVLWSLPLALGPPGFSLDVYSYLAQGRLAVVGLDPYRSSPSALDGGAWLHAVDPFWRHSVSPYGPLTTLVERAAASTGSPLAALLIVHALAWLSLAVIAAAVAAAAAAPQRSRALLLIALNPLLLLQLLGAAHWEAVMMALVAGALWGWQRGRPLTALALGSAAAAVKAPVGFAVLVLLLLHLIATPGPQRSRAGALAATVIAAPWLALAVLVQHPLGFLTGLSGPLVGRTLYAPTSALAEAMAGAGHLLCLQVPFTGLLSLCRVGGLVAAAAVCAWLLLTVRRRPAAGTIGLGLLAVALLGPVLYPWYLAWGLVPLALSYPRHHRLHVVVTTLACFTALPGCTALSQILLRHSPATIAGVAVLIASAATAAARQIRRDRATKLACRRVTAGGTASPPGPSTALNAHASPGGPRPAFSQLDIGDPALQRTR